MTVIVEPMTPNCGALIRGVDLSSRLSDEEIESLEKTLAERCVLVFRDQSMTPQQQKDLGQRFGRLHLHPAWPRLVKGHPEVMEIYADKNTKRIAGEDWHSDVSCDPHPPIGTILQMLEVPESGGDTLFANMSAAFAALSPALQQFLEGLTALHDGEQAYRGRYDGMQDEQLTYPRAEHPVVRVHPISGRKVLYVNRIFTTRLLELTATESDWMLRLLFSHIERPEFQCRLKWEVGTVAFWDNRCAQHYALWDYYPQRRRGLRVTMM